MKKKIIIFGATGNIGAYLTDYLASCELSKSFEIIAVGRRNTDFFNRYGIKYFSLDITKEEDFDKLPKDNVFAVVMLAGILPAFMLNYQPKKYLEINTIGGFNVVDYAREVKADRIIYTQSISDLSGYFDKERLLKPDMQRNINFNTDHSIYVISKCAVMDIIKNYQEMYGIKGFILRLPNIYMYTKNKTYYEDGIQKTFAYRQIIDKALNGESIEVWGDYNKQKDLVYVKDFCQMVERSIKADNNGGVYNVGTGIGTTLLEQIQGIIDVFSPSDNKSKIVFKPNIAIKPEYIMDIANAKSELGYTPKYYYIDSLVDLKKEMELDRFSELEKSFVKE